MIVPLILIQVLQSYKEENNNLNKSEKKNKTTYKSIKFQKKYGVYNKEERKLLEISQNENKDEINEDNIKIPLSSLLQILFEFNSQKTMTTSILKK